MSTNARHFWYHASRWGSMPSVQNASGYYIVMPLGGSIAFSIQGLIQWLDHGPAFNLTSTGRKAMKGYWLILSEGVKDQDAQKRYADLWTPIAARYEAKVKALDTQTVLREGRTTARVVVVEFPSYEQAKACYEDAAYHEAASFATQASNRELLILQGELI